MAIRKYRPANGSEGDYFMERFCNQCVHENQEEDKCCHILTATEIFGEDDKYYPEQWQYGADGKPLCTKFNGGSHEP